MSPAITVLLPVYNAEAYLAEAIESILQQSFTDFELLIINDGSTDGSKKVIESFHDPRIRLVNNEKNLRLIATLNKGFQLAKGKYIARMDADDISLPERLKKQYEFMEAHPEVGICGTGFETFGNEINTVFYPQADHEIRIMMLYQTALCHPTVMLRKEVFLSHKLFFNPEFLHAEDYELWIRAADFTQFANLPETLLKYRVHGDNVSQANRDIQHQNTIRIIQEYVKKAGAELNELEVEKFRDIAYASFPADTNEMMVQEHILLRLFEANGKSRYLPVAPLEKFIGERWEGICLNMTAAGVQVFRHVSRSKLTRLIPGRRKFMLKLLLKMLLKIR